MSAPPSRTEIARMEKRRCAAVAGKGVVLELDQRWTHEEVTNFLRKLFPFPFGYAEKNVQDMRRLNRHSVPLWVLVNKEHRAFDVVPSECPDRAELYRYKGRPGASSAECSIYIGL